MQYDIAVVGAGVAGLVLCDRLMASNKYLKIVLINADDRLGGRVFTDDDFDVDLGAQWFGLKHAKLREYVQELMLETEEQETFESGGCFVGLAGLRAPDFSPDEQAEVNAFFEKLNAFDAMNAPVDVAREADNMSAQAFIELHVKQENVRLELCRLVSTSLSVPANEVSMWFFLFWYRGNGGLESLLDHGEQSSQRFKLNYGMKSFTQALQSRIRRAGVVVHTGMVVKTIQQESDRVVINEGVIQVYNCFVCIAPQLWNAIDFVPSLERNTNLTRFANSLQPGQACKVVLVYERAFWLNAPREVSNLRNLLFPAENIFTGATGDGDPALVCLITARNAQVYRSMTPEARRDALVNQVNELFGNSLPPVQFLEMLWDGQQSFTTGCFFGVPRPGQNAHVRREIAEFRHGRVYFACSELSTNHYGYVEGAICSADDCLRAYNQTPEQVVTIVQTIPVPPNRKEQFDRMFVERMFEPLLRLDVEHKIEETFAFVRSDNVQVQMSKDTDMLLIQLILPPVEHAKLLNIVKNGRRYVSIGSVYLAPSGGMDFMLASFAFTEENSTGFEVRIGPY